MKVGEREREREFKNRGVPICPEWYWKVEISKFVRIQEEEEEIFKMNLKKN